MKKLFREILSLMLALNLVVFSAPAYADFELGKTGEMISAEAQYAALWTVRAAAEQALDVKNLLQANAIAPKDGKLIITLPIEAVVIVSSAATWRVLSRLDSSLLRRMDNYVAREANHILALGTELEAKMESNRSSAGIKSDSARWNRDFAHSTRQSYAISSRPGRTDYNRRSAEIRAEKWELRADDAASDVARLNAEYAELEKQYSALEARALKLEGADDSARIIRRFTRPLVVIGATVAAASLLFYGTSLNYLAFELSEAEVQDLIKSVNTKMSQLDN